MARAPVERIRTTELLQPQAAPVSTYVQPEAPTRSSLWGLAEGLRSLDSGLDSYVSKQEAKRKEEDALKGEAAFYKSNQQGFSEAVASGTIPSFASPAFVRAYKAAQGAAAGYQLEQKFYAAYDQWAGKTNPDPAAFGAFAQDFIKGNVTTDDPDVLRGLLPHVNAITQAGTAKHIQDAHDATYNGAIATNAAVIDQSIDAADAQGLTSEKGVDYDAAFAKVTSLRATALAAGVRADDFDPKMLDAIAAKALEHRDPSYLKFFEQTVPGKSYTWANTPYGQKLKMEVTDKLETMGRQALTEDRLQKERADKEAKDLVTSRAIEFLAGSPNAPVPDDLLKSGKKYDPLFQVHINEWRQNIRTGGASSDPQAMLQLHDKILNGGGLDAVREAMTNGVIRSSADLDGAYSLVKQYAEGGKKVGEILRSNSAEMVLNTIRQRTAGPNDPNNPFAPPSYTDAGLAASYDFRRQMLGWVTAHPDASAMDQEDAIAKIGKGILDGIGNAGVMEKPSYQSPAPGANPYAASAAPAVTPQAAPQVTPPASTPAPVTNPAVPIVPPVDPKAVEGWYQNDLTKDQQKVLQDLAGQSGRPLDDIKRSFYEAQQKVFQEEMAKPDKQSAVTPDGTPIEPASFGLPQGASAFTEALAQVAGSEAGNAIEAMLTQPEGGQRHAFEAGVPVQDSEAVPFLISRLVGHDRSHIDNMQPPLRQRLAALFEAAPPGIREGLGIYSGARSRQRQAELFAASDRSGRMVGTPNGSQHVHGNAADLAFRGRSLSRAPAHVVRWVHENAARFGLKFPMSYENWHIETQETRGGRPFVAPEPNTTSA